MTTTMKGRTGLKENPHANTLGRSSRLFWEKKAPEYTLPFNEKTLARTNQIIGIMESRGLPLEGSRILDIGSGPGTFALPLALRGASVTALDISDHMLKRLKAEAQRLGILGIETIRASWKKFDPIQAGLSGSFDLVLSARSIAIETRRDILKMEQCSRQWCVCIASGEIRLDSQCELMMRMIRVPFNPRPDIRTIRGKLESRGKSFSYDFITITITEKKTIRELAEDMAKRLEAEGEKTDRSRILTAVSSFFPYSAENDTIECIRQADTGVLIWRANEG